MFQAVHTPKACNSMIPQLPKTHSIAPQYALFLKELQNAGFCGDINSDQATRLVASTDNSVYQIVPQAVIFPRHIEDLKKIFDLMNQERFKKIKVTPRGGGTGTNGQALSYELVIDVTKYMNQIIDFNPKELWVCLEPGVVLDQLNDFLKPHNLFFAPSVSSSSRATLGGMISTDASGKGSRVYGRTSRYIMEMESILVDGTVIRTQSVRREELSRIKKEKNVLADIYRLIDRIITEKKDQIEQSCPKINRFLTGYNLDHIYSEDGKHFNINQLFAGSEGTLTLITEAKLRLLPIPEHKQLVLIKYRSFDDALADAEELINIEPAAVETIDEKILQLAKDDKIYHKVQHMIADEAHAKTGTINLVELHSDDGKEIEQRTNQLVRYLKSSFHKTNKTIGYHAAINADETAVLWEFRKKGVSLLSNTRSNRKPIPFVEDTAVPPQKLARYIKEFRAILEDDGLDYGMFGHVDVGCLHVRPALDMKMPDDERLLKKISDRIARLVRHHGGVIWGEHGKGFRSQYTEEFFGPDLYQALRRIKKLFDPDNRLNPGKIVTPVDSEDKVYPIHSSTRGQSDRQIHPKMMASFENTINCNGNGACFNYNPNDVMCPSSKSTRDRIHSPKGRAGVLREWLRQLSEVGFEMTERQSTNSISALIKKTWNTIGQKLGCYDFSHEVHWAMKGCLSCKACTSQCPIKVDIPESKARFYHQYHTRYLRPLRDYLVGNIEAMAQVQSYFSGIVNLFIKRKLAQFIIEFTTGVKDAPCLSEKSVDKGLAEKKAPKWDFEQINELDQTDKSNAVILLQDAFTSFYDSRVVFSIYDFLTKLGIRVYVLPFIPNGKPLHIKGFLGQFKQTAHDATEFLSNVAKCQIPMVGIDPAIVLSYRDEYPKILEKQDLGFEIELLQNWLEKKLPEIKADHPNIFEVTSRNNYFLFGHCTEKTAAPQSQANWQFLFSEFNQKLELIQTGCCGMGGDYGHETENYNESQNIFNMSWRDKIKDLNASEENILVAGYSCRCQVKRFAGIEPSHPIEALLKLMSE